MDYSRPVKRSACWRSSTSAAVWLLPAVTDTRWHVEVQTRQHLSRVFRLPMGARIYRRAQHGSRNVSELSPSQPTAHPSFPAPRSFREPAFLLSLCRGTAGGRYGRHRPHSVDWEVFSERLVEVDEAGRLLE